MKKIRTVIIAMVFVAVMTAVFVGCSPVEQQKEEPKITYYDYGTRTYHLSTENESESGYVSFWLPDMLEGRENNDKYVEFWGENGLKERQTYYYNLSYYNFGFLYRQSYSTTHTIKNVSEIAAENITFVNGKDKLSPGEILVHKWDYLNMCLDFSGLYVSGDTLDRQVIVSDNVLPKYIMTLSTHGSICNLGLAADYYNLISSGASSAYIHYKDDIVVTIGKESSTNSAKIEYKVAGYYVNPTDSEFLAETYTMDQFTGVMNVDDLGRTPMTKTERAIYKKIAKITDAIYVCNEEQI